MYSTSQKLFVRLFVSRMSGSSLVFRAPIGVRSDLGDIIEAIPLQAQYRRGGRGGVEFYLPYELHSATSTVTGTSIREWRSGRDECLEFLGRCVERSLLLVATPLRRDEIEHLSQAWFRCHELLTPLTRQIPVERDYDWTE